MKAVVFATDPQNRNQYILTAIGDALAARLGAGNVFRPGYRDLVSTCQDNEIDLLLVLGGAGAILGPVERALGLVKTSVLWVSEDPYETERNVTIAPLFNIVFSNDISTVHRYPNAAGCLPFAADPALHDLPVLERSEDFLFDLFFVGSAWPNRVASLNELIGHLPRSLRIKIGLAGNSFLPDYTINDLNLITNFRVAPRDFARMANASLVSLTLDRTFSGGTSEPVQGDTPPPRLFELALAGAAQVYVTDRNAVAEHFAPGLEIVTASDAKSAAEAVMAIVGDPERRRDLALAARRRAQAEHLYAHRIDAILSAVRQHAPKPRPAVNMASAKRRVLIVTHNKVGSSRGYGGIELYQQTLSEALAPNGYEFLFLYPDTDGRMVFCDASGGQEQRFNVPVDTEFMINCPVREELFARLLQTERIDLVHVQHTMGHSLSLSMIARSLGVPNVFTANDFYGVCREFNLLGLNETYCDVPDNRTEVCDICLSTRGIAPPGAQARRRFAFAEFLRHTDRILHVSHSARRKFVAVYPEIEPDKQLMLGCTGRPETFQRIAAARDGRKAANERLQVAILGNFTKPKGGDLLLLMFAQMQHDAVDFHIVGRVDENLEAGLLTPKFPNVVLHGAFTQSELPDRLRDMDISVHFSKWPETYCITLDEARAAGMFPIVLGYGALGERVNDWKDGIIIDPARPFDLMHVLRRLIADRQVLEDFDYPLSVLQDAHRQHVAAVDRLYTDLMTARPRAALMFAGTGRPLLMSDFDRRYNSAQWRDFDVVADETFDVTASLCLKIEAAGASASAVAVAATDAVTVADELPVPLESAMLSIDEICCPMTARRVVSLAQGRRPVALGFAPADGDSVALADIVLRGASTWRIAGRDAVVSDGGRAWQVALADMSAVPDGTYQVLVGVRSGRSLRRFGTAITLRLGEGVAEMVAPALSRIVQDPQRRAAELTRMEEARRRAAARASSRRARRMSPYQRLRVSVRDVVRTIKGQRLQYSIDTIQGSLYRFGDVKVKAKSRFAIEGWCVAPDGTCCKTVTLTLLSDGAIVSADAVTVVRPDLATYFGNPDLARAGFKWICPVPLAPGTYAMELTATLNDGDAIIIEAGEFQVI